MTQQLLPAIHVEATGEDARRMLACVKACSGMPTSALEAGILGELLEQLVAFWERGEDIDSEREMWLLERLGFLGGAAAACCERSETRVTGLAAAEGKAP